ncbi:hypothetical protein Tco_1143580 [Tanacetum coccineum]|uniref:Uncharacterized protein n=1 Tax=Tanacetum coccineum TaxID=301880 RepID=A0ABQ5D3Q1_9ASTR
MVLSHFPCDFAQKHLSDTQVITVKMEILLEPTSNKLMVGLRYSDTVVLLKATKLLKLKKHQERCIIKAVQVKQIKKGVFRLSEHERKVEALSKVDHSEVIKESVQANVRLKALFEKYSKRLQLFLLNLLLLLDNLLPEQLTEELVKEPIHEVAMDVEEPILDDVVTARRADRQEYPFKEGDFSRLHLNDIEYMLLFHVQNKLFNLLGDDIVDLVNALRMFTQSLVIKKRVKDVQLGVESYQKKLNNPHKPQKEFPGI